MDDDIDKAMRQPFDVFAADVDEVLGKARVKEFVRFETLGSAVPWRPAEVGWPVPELPLDDLTCQQADVRVDEAHEVAFALALGLDDVASDVEGCRRRLKDAAERVRRAYESRVLELVTAAASSDLYTAPRVAELVAVDGWWRLLGSGPVAESTKSDGTAEVTNPEGALSAQGRVRALLVETMVGPAVQELPAPALSWRRGTPQPIRLVISRRFFFDAGRGSVALH
jgi:hypothetical protein